MRLARIACTPLEHYARSSVIPPLMKVPLPVFAAAGLLIPLLAHAVPEPSSTPPPTVLKPIQFIQYDLPNGLHVILHENQAAPVISTYLLYHVGSKNERPDRTGFAHFFEHLMFEGTQNIERSRIDKLISGAGGNLNASTSFDQTDYYFNLPANQLKLALWIESERMLHAKIDEIGVETQRKVVKEERRKGVDNQPYGSLFEELSALVFKGSPYSWTPIGSLQYIDQATIEEFRAFYKKYYIPNNATLSVAGAINVEETKALIEAYFGAIPRGPEIERPVVDLPAGPGEQKEVLKDNTPLPATLHAWRAPIETHPDAYPIEMLTNILATGRSSRLYRRLVEKEQAALEVEAFPYLLEKAGMIGIMATGQSGTTLDQLDQLVTEEVETVKKSGVTEEEFQKARNSKETEFAAAFGTMAQRARNLARYHLFYGDANLINTELDRYLKVKREDLQKVANTYLGKENSYRLRFPVPVAKVPSTPGSEQKPAPAGAAAAQ